MMRRILLTAAAALVLPATASAQTMGIGIGARAGTMGVGGEAAVGFGNLVVRGGFGVVPFEYTSEYSGIDYKIEPTSPLMNIGVDYYLGRTLRIGGGMLLINEPTTLNGEFEGTVQIGGRTYTDSEVGALVGELDHGGNAPYVLVGFGRHTDTGFGMFLDLGAAFLKESTLTLESSGLASQNAQFRADLETERADAEQKAKDYLKILPIVSLGLRFGIGI